MILAVSKISEEAVDNTLSAYFCGSRLLILSIFKFLQVKFIIQ